MQGQCKPNAIELARIAEVQPVLAKLFAKICMIFQAYNSRYPHSETLRKNENPIRKNLRKTAYLRPLIRQKKRFTMLFLRVVS